MSEPKPAIVYVTTGINKLTQDARRALVRNIECERELTHGFVPKWMNLAQIALQPSNSFSMPVGWIGLVITDHNGTYMCKSYAIVGSGLNDECVQAIGLRTALLATYPVRDITVYMSTNVITSMFTDPATQEVSDMWVNEGWELVGPNVDTLKECGRIVKIRTSLGRKTTVSLNTIQGHSDKLAKMVEHTNRVEYGCVDNVIYIPSSNGNDGCAKRLSDAALQLGMTLDTVEKATYATELTVARSNRNYINGVIDDAAENTDSGSYHVGDPSLSVICSSCMNAVRITCRDYGDVVLINAVVTTHCKSCIAAGESSTKFKPTLVKSLVGYDVIRKHSSARTVITGDSKHVQHVDVKDIFDAITRGHSIAMLDYDNKTMGELRGGFF